MKSDISETEFQTNKFPCDFPATLNRNNRAFNSHARNKLQSQEARVVEGCGNLPTEEGRPY